MKTENIIKALGKKQKSLLKALDEEPVEISAAESLSHITRGLNALELTEYSENYLYLSIKGKEFILNNRTELFSAIDSTREEILNRLLRLAPEKSLKLKKREYLLLVFLAQAPRSKAEIKSAKNIIPVLTEANLINENEDTLSITETGKNILAEYPDDYCDEKPEEVFLATGRIQAKHAVQEKAEIFLGLYRQGLTYQEIGDLYELTRERVRQILNKTPNFELYLEEYEQAKIERELEKEKDAKFKLIEKSLATQFPERVDELWDWEKNGDLNPAEISAHSGNYEIWFKCPKDGHSWKKKPSDIVTSWIRSKTSGCPACAGKLNKAQKQQTLTEVYPEYVEKYWNHEKNSAEGNYPDELTLGSNRKVWLKCPIDDNEWHANLAATIKQQWSRENPGCRVCNGTADRRIGEWEKALPLAEKFPEQVALYWCYEKNAEKNLNPQEVTAGSSKEAWFKCPLDGHIWQAKIAAVNNSWKNGNSGCPACRGFSATEDNSLTNVYPDFISRFWDYEKNTELGLKPEDITCGTHRQAWFKCPSDNEEWFMKINYLTGYFWKQGRTGCPQCGRY